MTARTPPRPYWALVAVASVVVLAADQLSKRWALTTLADGHTIPVVWTLQLAPRPSSTSCFDHERADRKAVPNQELQKTALVRRPAIAYVYQRSCA